MTPSEKLVSEVMDAIYRTKKFSKPLRYASKGAQARVRAEAQAAIAIVLRYASKAAADVGDSCRETSPEWREGYQCAAGEIADAFDDMLALSNQDSEL